MRSFAGGGRSGSSCFAPLPARPGSMPACSAGTRPTGLPGPADGPPAAFAALFAEETARWRDVANGAGIERQ